MKILTLPQIKSVLPGIDLVAEIEAGFVALSEGKAVVAPVGELLLKDPPGDVHIKYGYLRGDDYYVIKIASGFYGNAELGLPSSNGMMLAFSQQTGEPVALLLDEGYLTDIRTAVAGAIAGKYLAPRKVERIGIVGTGMQARLQLVYLAPVTDCRDVLVWGRSANNLAAYQASLQPQGFTVATTKDADDVLQSCNLIVTTTPSEAAILVDAGKLRPGSHITAMGSDTHVKRELSAEIMQAADLLVADSIAQCLERGEIHQAIKDGAIRREAVVELGDIISGAAPGRTSDAQITIADLTGVAVQDIQITKAVLDAAQ
jgi:ornithine cyclodeaminase